MTARRAASKAVEEAGRSRERHRRARLSSLGLAAARGVSMLTGLISIPLTVGYLGPERFGFWMTASSLLMFFNLADLGLGNGLLNALATAHGRGDKAAARRSLSSAFFLLLAVALGIALLLVAAWAWIPWAKAFNLSSSLAAAEAGPAMAVFCACLCLGLPLALVQQAFQGYQEGYLASLWNAAGSLLGLAGVLLAIHSQAGLPWLVLAMAGAPLLAQALAGLDLFLRRRPWLRPGLSHADGPTARRLLSLGAYFFLLQAAYAFTFSSDNLVAARALGPEAVALYSVAFKLFAAVQAILAMLLVPLWPAYGEAAARGDKTWVLAALKRSVLFAALGGGGASLLLAAFGGRIVDLWVGPGLRPGPGLLLGLAAWTFLYGVGTAVAMALNGLGRLRFQAATALLTAAAALVLKLTLVRSHGPAALAWSTALAYLVFSALPTALYLPGALAAFRSSKLRPAQKG